MREAAGALARAERVTRRVLGLPAAPAAPLPEGSTAASRQQIVRGLHRVFFVARPKFRYTPFPSPIDAVRYRGQPAGEQIRELVEWGALAPTGPLAIGPGETVALRDFGEALGFLFIRLADLTHTASAKWSPKLQD
jgi:hypothetical protein